TLQHSNSRTRTGTRTNLPEFVRFRQFRLLQCAPTRATLPLMKRIGLIALVFLAALPVRAQEHEMTADELMKSAEQWARENLDDDTLRALQNVDREKVKAFLASIQKDFHGEYVVDLAQLREPARLILPVLESHEETLPYALWLRPRLDYLDTADEL